MLKKILNEAVITFRIEATGPILIKAGETVEETDKKTNKMFFVIDANEEIFIPGSSIKGVWRSWCEKIARTISTEVPPLSCDPLCDNNNSEHFSCSKRLEELKKQNPNVYALSCPICKIFGNTSLGSRIKFSDAILSDSKYLLSWDEIQGNDYKILIEFLILNYGVDWVKKATIVRDNDKTLSMTSKKNSLSLNLNNENTELNLKIDDNKIDKFIVKNEGGKLNIYYTANRKRSTLSTRDGVSIDRFTGGVQFLFNYQYVLDREFTTKIQIRNFELWQLGMLAFLRRDFEDELVPIGYGKTRGLGKVKGTIELMTITYYGLNKPVIDIDNKIATITGVGKLFDDPGNSEGYNFNNESSIEGIKFDKFIGGPIKTQIELNKDQSKDLMDKSAPYWVEIKNEKPDGYSVKSQSIRKGLLEEYIVTGEDA